MATIGERVRVFVAEARGQRLPVLPTSPANPDRIMGIGRQVSGYVRGIQLDDPGNLPQNVHMSAPYTPGEATRGPSIFPPLGSTNANSPGLPTLPSLPLLPGRTRAVLPSLPSLPNLPVGINAGLAVTRANLTIPQLPTQAVGSSVLQVGAGTQDAVAAKLRLPSSTNPSDVGVSSLAGRR